MFSFMSDTDMNAFNVSCTLTPYLNEDVTFEDLMNVASNLLPRIKDWDHEFNQFTLKFNKFVVYDNSRCTRFSSSKENVDKDVVSMCKMVYGRLPELNNVVITSIQTCINVMICKYFMHRIMSQGNYRVVYNECLSDIDKDHDFHRMPRTEIYNTFKALKRYIYLALCVLAPDYMYNFFLLFKNNRHTRILRHTDFKDNDVVDPNCHYDIAFVYQVIYNSRMSILLCNPKVSSNFNHIFQYELCAYETYKSHEETKGNVTVMFKPHANKLSSGGTILTANFKEYDDLMPNSEIKQYLYSLINNIVHANNNRQSHSLIDAYNKYALSIINDNNTTIDDIQRRINDRRLITLPWCKKQETAITEYKLLPISKYIRERGYTNVFDSIQTDVGVKTQLYCTVLYTNKLTEYIGTLDTYRSTCSIKVNFNKRVKPDFKVAVIPSGKYNVATRTDILNKLSAVRTFDKETNQMTVTGLVFIEGYSVQLNYLFDIPEMLNTNYIRLVDPSGRPCEVRFDGNIYHNGDYAAELISLDMLNKTELTSNILIEYLNVMINILGKDISIDDNTRIITNIAENKHKTLVRYINGIVNHLICSIINSHTYEISNKIASINDITRVILYTGKNIIDNLLILLNDTALPINIRLNIWCLFILKSLANEAGFHHIMVYLMNDTHTILYDSKYKLDKLIAS